jgi:Carboxypeptidase regulatory-like domain/TonB dependent receptor
MNNVSGNRLVRGVMLRLLAVLLAPGFVVPSLAQFTTARLTGSVLDPSGLGLAGAAVTVKDQRTAFTRSTTTNNSGEYVFPSLPVGTYQISVAMTGFTSYVQSGIELQVDQSVTVPVHMKLGTVTQQVTVEGAASMVTTETPTVAQVINQKDVAELPLNTRYTQQLVFLAPGALNVTANYCAAGCEGATFPSEQYAKVNGAGANGVTYHMDGADFNDVYLNMNMPFPNPDAVQEFDVQTNNMSAVYGNALGGVVNVTLKSGTNSTHGDLFEFLRNDFFDAKNFFSTTGISPYRQNQFGGDVGGPILKDRLFYFGSYQGTRFHLTNALGFAFVPDAAERRGDFSELLPGTQLVNPATGVPYNNNRVPVDPVAAFILKGIPLPNPTSLQLSQGEANAMNYSSLPTVEDTDEYLGKIDYNFGKHRLSGHYFQQKYNVPIVSPPLASASATASNPDPATNYLQMSGGAQALTDHNVSVNYTLTISPHFMLGTYYGYTKLTGTTYASNPFTMVDAGVNMAVPAAGGKGNIASLNVGTAEFGVGSGVYGSFNRGVQSFREIATLVKGKHTIQFGGDAVRLRQPMANTFQEGGTFSFSNLSGNGFADFEIGYVNSFIQGGGLYLDFTGINWSAFIQDDWKVTPRLTLSAGLRWDPFIPPKDSLGRVACFEPGQQSARYPNAPNGLLYGGSHHDPGCPEAAIFNNLPNFGPRLGFAYRLTRDGKTSIRGGAGYYYEPPNSLIYQQIVGVPPFAPVFNLFGVSLDDPYNVSGGGTNPFPTNFGPRNPPSNTPFLGGPPSFSQIQDPHLRMPLTLGWNLTVERALGSDWMLRAAYVGNEGRRLFGTGDQESGLLQLNPAIYNPALSFQDNENTIQQRRPNQNFGSVAEINSGVNSNYNSLQLTLEKRFAHGLSLLSNFAWSKTLDDFAPNPQGSAGSQYTNSCTCGRHFDYGRSVDDLNKVFKINGNYEIPHLRVNSFADKLVNGWQLTAIIAWQSGFPYTVFSGIDNSTSALGEDRADSVAVSGPAPPQSIREWFNVNAFTENAVGTFGDIGKNSLRGPRFSNTDLALIKKIPVGERVSVTFRAEFFNAFNHPNFGTPGNNVAAGPPPGGGFGVISGTAGYQSYNSTTYGMAEPRIMQFGLKISL